MPSLYTLTTLSVLLTIGTCYHVICILVTPPDTPISKLRIPGVLQRFSITYLVVALTELLTVPLYQRVNVSDT